MSKEEIDDLHVLSCYNCNPGGSYCPSNLKYIEDDSDRYSLYKEIFKKNGSLWIDVPEEERTYDLFKIAINCGDMSLILEEAPKYGEDQDNTGFLDYDTAKIAVKSNYTCLYHLPSKFITEELCHIALLSNPKAIEIILKHIGFSETLYRYNPACAYFLSENYIERFIKEYEP